MQEERRKDYVELAKIEALLGKLMERLDNTINALNKHIKDDEDIASDVDMLKNFKSNIFGIVIGATAAGGILGFVITISTRFMGGH